MDYQGNYFPDDQDENSSKTYRTIKGIFKWTMYGISFLLYAVLFIIMFINRESDIIENNYVHEIDAYNIDVDTIELYRINPRIFMNENGSIQVSNVDYFNEHDLIEIGIKFNINKLTDNNANGLEFKFYDNDGNEYNEIYSKSDKGGRYGYFRLCFESVDLDLDSNDLRYDPLKSEFPRTNDAYYLDVYKIDDGSLIFTFEIYNNKTVFSKTEYEN